MHDAYVEVMGTERPAIAWPIQNNQNVNDDDVDFDILKGFVVPIHVQPSSSDNATKDRMVDATGVVPDGIMPNSVMTICETEI